MTAKVLLKPPVAKIVFIGNSGVGKTALQRRFVSGRYVQGAPNTVGVEFFHKHVTIEEVNYQLQFWDTAGQQHAPNITANYYRDAHCCVLVFDVTDACSFNALDSWIKDFVFKSGVHDPANFPFVLLGNKVDVTASHEVSAAAALNWCRFGRSLQYFEVSARDEINVDQAFAHITSLAVAQMEKTRRTKADESVRLHRPGRRSKCCSILG